MAEKIETVYGKVMDYARAGVEARGLELSVTRLKFGEYERDESGKFADLNPVVTYRPSFFGQGGFFRVTQEMVLGNGALWITPSEYHADRYTIDDDIRRELLRKRDENLFFSLTDDPNITKHATLARMLVEFTHPDEQGNLELRAMIENDGSVMLRPGAHPYILIPNNGDTPLVEEANPENRERYRLNTGTYQAMIDFLMDLAAGENSQLVNTLIPVGRL